MGSWRLIVSPKLKLDFDDPDSRLLIEWLVHRLIPEIKAMPYDFTVSIEPEDDPSD